MFGFEAQKLAQMLSKNAKADFRDTIKVYPEDMVPGAQSKTRVIWKLQENIAKQEQEE